jgi:hypothetical protein
MYMTPELGPGGLVSADLDNIAVSSRIPPHTKRALLRAVPEPYRPNPEAATALAALADADTVTPDTLIALADSGAPSASVIRLAATIRHAITETQWNRLMTALRGDFALVAGTNNKKHIHLTNTDGLEAVLASLKAAGLIVRYRKASGKDDQIVVTLRQPSN